MKLVFGGQLSTKQKVMKIIINLDYEIMAELSFEIKEDNTVDHHIQCTDVKDLNLIIDTISMANDYISELLQKLQVEE